MRIIYNGVDMKVLELVEAVCEPIYDSSQTDLLYCRYYISANVMVNGQAEVREVAGPPLSYKYGANINHYTMQANTRPPGLAKPPAVFAAPTDLNTATVGQTAYILDSGENPLTDSAVSRPVASASTRSVIDIVPSPGPTGITHKLLNSRLNEPRAQLWVFSGDGRVDELIVRSHGYTDYTDCRNGPLPIATTITRAFGDGDTYFLNFQIQTFVNLHNYLSGESPPTLLSNRFSVTHALDEDQILTILVNGEAHMRTDHLYSLGFTPDAFRALLFLPPPFGHVRGNIVVKGLPDCSGVQYSYQDRQMPVHFVAGRYVLATRIEANHRQSLGNGKDIFNTALDAYQRQQRIRLDNKWLHEAKDGPVGRRSRRSRP